MRKASDLVLYEQFDEFLNDCLPAIKIGEIEYEAARSWKLIDEIAYDQEYSAWLDNQLRDGLVVEKDGDYYFPDQEEEDDA